MYLRTTSRKNKDGSVVEYYQLAHKERHPETRKPVARIIHNFGRADTVDREQLVRLCRSIGRICGLEFTDPIADAEAIASETGTFEDFKIKKTLAYGCPMVIETLWERLGIKKVLTRISQSKGMRIPYERALLAMTANRLCEPESKLGVWDRWIDKVFLPSCQGLKLRHMYDAMDLLHEHAPEVEEAVFTTRQRPHSILTKKMTAGMRMQPSVSSAMPKKVTGHRRLWWHLPLPGKAFRSGHGFFRGIRLMSAQWKPSGRIFGDGSWGVHCLLPIRA